MPIEPVEPVDPGANDGGGGEDGEGGEGEGEDNNDEKFQEELKEFKKGQEDSKNDEEQSGTTTTAETNELTEEEKAAQLKEKIRESMQEDIDAAVDRKLKEAKTSGRVKVILGIVTILGVVGGVLYKVYMAGQKKLTQSASDCGATCRSGASGTCTFKGKKEEAAQCAPPNNRRKITSIIGQATNLLSNVAYLPGCCADGDTTQESCTFVGTALVPDTSPSAWSSGASPSCDNKTYCSKKVCSDDIRAARAREYCNNNIEDCAEKGIQVLDDALKDFFDPLLILIAIEVVGILTEFLPLPGFVSNIIHICMIIFAISWYFYYKDQLSESGGILWDMIP